MTLNQEKAVKLILTLLKDNVINDETAFTIINGVVEDNVVYRWTAPFTYTDNNTTNKPYYYDLNKVTCTQTNSVDTM